MRTIPCVLGALLVMGLSIGVWADEQCGVASGCEVGGPTPPFKVLDVTGPYKGQALCYV